jgi:4-methyl-5(b-hydroxyethyl)-thiazole monophosphate biosynthesis
MPKAILLLAEGFEEIEAVTVIDVLRRSGVAVTAAALSGLHVRGAHDIVMQADVSLDDVEALDFDALILPGGQPGSTNLQQDARVLALVRRFVNSQKLTAAICAAPTVLEAAGVLSGRRATCYPGYELPSARFEESAVVEDGFILTSRGAGTAFEFAFALVRRLCGAPSVETQREKLLVAAP